VKDKIKNQAVTSSKDTNMKADVDISVKAFTQEKKVARMVDEQSLEELRVEKGFYRLAFYDFSLIVTYSEADNESCTSMDENNCSINRSTVMEDSSQCKPNSSQMRCGNDSVSSPYTNISQYLVSTSVNESQASSTVNDREAVGGILKAEDETINTRFARAEMSLMFSSPAEQEAQFSESKPLFLSRTSANYKIDSSVLDISAIPAAESHHKQISSRTALRSTPVTSLGGLFEIYSDENYGNYVQKNNDAKAGGDDTCFLGNNENNYNQHHNIEDGCTASFSVFGDLMDEVGVATDIERQVKKSTASRFSVFEESSITGAVHEKKKSHDVVLSHAEVHNESIGYSLALIVLGKNVLDRRDVLLPTGLNRSKPTLGLKISLLNDKFLVQNELGRGAHGTVLLCSNTKDEYVALKVQSPTGCLAHEFHILSCLEKRMKSKGYFDAQSTNMFPRPLHFVAHGDGSLLAMTTASRSGLNLIDLVNLYHKLEGGQVPELLVMFYVSKMLQYLAILHSRCSILVSEQLMNACVSKPFAVIFGKS
jgi:hypothetical protein